MKLRSKNFKILQLKKKTTTTNFSSFPLTFGFEFLLTLIK